MPNVKNRAVGACFLARSMISSVLVTSPSVSSRTWRGNPPSRGAPRRVPPKPFTACHIEGGGSIGPWPTTYSSAASSSVPPMSASSELTNAAAFFIDSSS